MLPALGSRVCKWSLLEMLLEYHPELLHRAGRRWTDTRGVLSLGWLEEVILGKI